MSVNDVIKACIADVTAREKEAKARNAVLGGKAVLDISKFARQAVEARQNALVEAAIDDVADATVGEAVGGPKKK